MPALLVKNLPVDLHERLKRRALAHHRSMNREVLAILEKEIGSHITRNLPPPVGKMRNGDHVRIAKSIRDARDAGG